jgi:hypothetical protein
VNNAFFSSLIQAADGFKHNGLIGLASFNSGTRITDSCPGSAAEGTVSQATFFVLTIAFDLGLNVCQGISSENDSNTTGLNSTREPVFCPAKNAQITGKNALPPNLVAGLGD